MKKYLLLVLLLITPGVHAAYETGNDLLAQCESDDLFMEGVCAGYIAGVSDVSRGETWGGNRYCAPAGVTIRQLQKIVIKYLNEHPETLHDDASSLVQNAFAHAFPCSE